MLVGDEGAGIVEVDIVIGKALRKTPDVVEATKTNDAINQLRVTKCEVHGMIRAKACAGCHQKGIGIALLAEWHNFVQQVAIVLDVSPRALRRVPLFAIPAFAIDAIYTIQLDFTLFQALTEHSNHTRIFPLEETSHRSGENEHPGPRMTKDQQLHVTIKGTTIPTMIFTIHTVTHSHWL